MLRSLPLLALVACATPGERPSDGATRRPAPPTTETALQLVGWGGFMMLVSAAGAGLLLGRDAVERS